MVATANAIAKVCALAKTSWYLFLNVDNKKDPKSLLSILSIKTNKQKPYTL